MKNFVGYIENDRFAVGCTGGSVYVYDNRGIQIKKFSDIKYGYVPLFCPSKNILVVKSTIGLIAVYSLDTMQLTNKFRYSSIDYAQNDGWCFSNDGQYLYNIERYKDFFHSRISVYETGEFQCIKRLFTDEPSLALNEIEYDFIKDSIYVLGFSRDSDNIAHDFFVAQLISGTLINKTFIEVDKYYFIKAYKDLEKFGFTPNAYESSSFINEEYSLNEIKSKKIMLSDYIEESFQP